MSTASGITTANVSGTRNWYIGGPFGDLGKVANANNFGGTGAADDWLILPPINTHFLSGETFSFVSEARFNDNGLATLPNTGPPTANPPVGLDILVSADYNPAVHTNPSSATWVLLNPYVTLESNFDTFGGGVPSGEVGLLSVPGVPEDGSLTIAFRYRASGTGSNAARHWEITDLVVRGECGLEFETTLAPFAPFSRSSGGNWAIGSAGGRNAALINNQGSSPANQPADDWLISPAFGVNDPAIALAFDYFEQGVDSGTAQPLAVLVSTDYDPANNPAHAADPASATWTNVTPAGLDGSASGIWKLIPNVPLGLTGANYNVHVAFRYSSSGTDSNSAKQIGVDNLCIRPGGGLDFSFTREGCNFTFVASIAGGTPPYTYLWDFGDGTTSTQESPTHNFDSGTYSVTLTITDAAGSQAQITKTNLISVSDLDLPAPAGTLRIATFNTAMNSGDINGNEADSNALENALFSGTSVKIKRIAETIQRVNPDVILVNEFDLGYNGQSFDASRTLARVNLFRNNYLGVPQAPDALAANYPYHFIGGTNTGLHSGFDLRNDGTIDNTAGDQTYGDDAFGFGQFPGKYGFIVLSKYPIDTAKARTFQFFRWMDMPGALLPEDPNDTDGNGDRLNYYTAPERNVFRLSSKSHWDIPVIVQGSTVHVLGSHPTPPTFDDGETTTHLLRTGTPATRADWNGLRNHDEIRFWADYINPANDDYIYDDAQWIAAGNQKPATPSGGLGANQRFVILGDQNADPDDGDSTFNPILMLLNNPQIDTSITPSSLGADEQINVGSNQGTKTSSFRLRADYALPSTFGFENILQAGVYWPRTSDCTFNLLSATDHRSVWLDLQVNPEGLPPERLSYNEYIQSYRFFSPGNPQQNPGDNPDGDGDTNFAEFAYGTDPTRATTAPTQPDRTTEGYEVVFQRNRAADVLWTIELADELAPPTNWRTGEEGADHEVISTALDLSDSRIEYVRIRLLFEPVNGKVFVRQRAVAAP